MPIVRKFRNQDFPWTSSHKGRKDIPWKTLKSKPHEETLKAVAVAMGNISLKAQEGRIVAPIHAVI